MGDAIAASRFATPGLRAGQPQRRMKRAGNIGGGNCTNVLGEGRVGIFVLLLHSFMTLAYWLLYICLKQKERRRERKMTLMLSLV